MRNWKEVYEIKMWGEGALVGKRAYDKLIKKFNESGIGRFNNLDEIIDAIDTVSEEFDMAFSHATSAAGDTNHENVTAVYSGKGGRFVVYIEKYMRYE